MVLQALTAHGLQQAATRGFQDNLLNPPLDGDMSNVGSGDPRKFWDEEDMTAMRDQVVAAVRACGSREWTQQHVYSPIEEFPKGGQMDEYRVGQEDEGDTCAEDLGAAWDDGMPGDSDVEDARPASGGDRAGGCEPDVGLLAQPLLDQTAALDRMHSYAVEVGDERILRLRLANAIRQCHAKAAHLRMVAGKRILRLPRLSAE